jgi:hypothetical protein
LAILANYESPFGSETINLTFAWVTAIQIVGVIISCNNSPIFIKSVWLVFEDLWIVAANDYTHYLDSGYPGKRQVYCLRPKRWLIIGQNGQKWKYLANFSETNHKLLMKIGQKLQLMVPHNMCIVVVLVNVNFFVPGPKDDS